MEYKKLKPYDYRNETFLEAEEIAKMVYHNLKFKLQDDSLPDEQKIELITDIITYKLSNKVVNKQCQNCRHYPIYTKMFAPYQCPQCKTLHEGYGYCGSDYLEG